MSRPAATAAVDREIRVAAPAKLNLYLHVVGLRADGYHLLDSLVAFADVHDDLVVRPAEALTLQITGRYAAALRNGEDNLVLRAARSLAHYAGVPPRAEISLEKRLPVAAGLGGGSTDAAAALKALDRLWGVGISPGEMHKLALALGADVPVCVVGRAAFVGGVGEAIDPAPRLPGAALIVVHPARALSTARVFARRAGGYSDPGRFAEAPDDARALAGLLATRRNDLTEASTALVPEVASALARLAAAPGCLLARMAGSGASCFGIFGDMAAAQAGAAAIAEAEPSWWVRATKLVSDPDPGAAPDQRRS